MGEVELSLQNLNITALLAEPEYLDGETKEEHRQRWAIALNNTLVRAADLMATILWEMREHGLYRELGFKSMRAFMHSEMCPVSQGHGAKMMAVIDRYHDEIGMEKTLSLMGELGISRMYSAAKAEYNIKEVDDSVEFIDADSGAVITLAELKDLGAHGAAERLRDLRKVHQETKDELESAEIEICELKDQLKMASGANELELKQKIKALEEELAELKDKKILEADLESQMDKHIKSIENAVNGLCDFSGRLLHQPVVEKLASCIGGAQIMLRKLQNEYEMGVD